jgi:hypothetical protein
LVRLKQLAEAEVVEQLAGQINAPANVEAVRAALERSFDRFLSTPSFPQTPTWSYSAVATGSSRC